MPAYNCQSTIGLALESLVRQTWRDIEIIVVDDCSTDDTWDIVRDFAHSHRNIRPYRQKRNQGAYAARNLGLEIASGDLITTHDADDWSHPQQIEVQTRRFVADAAVKASRCHWVRVGHDLRFRTLWRSEEVLVYPCWPSFMLRREVREQLGSWDRVRAAADTEYIDRARTVFGSDAVVDDRPDVPLKFSLISDTSLTRSSATSISTVSFGLRQDYKAAATWWHTLDSDTTRLKLDPSPSRRPFPAPASILPDRPPRPHYDLLVIGDTNSQSHAYRAAMTHVKDMIGKDSRVAIFHWPSFKSYRRTHPTVWSLAGAGKLDVISAGETVTAETLLVADPEPLQHPLDRYPIVTAKHFRVNAERHGTLEQRFDAELVVKVLKDTFGDAGDWTPLSREVSSLLPAHAESTPQRRQEGDEPLLSFDRDLLCRQLELWRAGDDSVTRQVSALIQRAEGAIQRGERLSVIDKTAVPPSGDLHDYMTIGPYWWPDPLDPDGPHVHRRDGIRIPAMQVGHPDSVKYDYTRSRYLFSDLTSLALAHFFTKDARFARAATRAINTWFVDPATRMNPNLRFAQVRLGHRQNRGTAYGLIDFRDLHYVLDAVRLLEELDQSIKQGLFTWLSQYLKWLTKSSSGEAAASAENNLGPWYDLQALAVAHYLGDRTAIDTTLNRARGRIGGHFEADGRQPHEVRRTLSQHYCAFNLQAWVYLASAAEVLGVDLWNFRTAYGGSLKAGLLWFLQHDGQEWPYQQIETFDRARLEPLCEAYLHAYGSDDDGLVGRILSSVAPSDDFANVGIRPFWRLGSLTAAEHSRRTQSLTSMSPRDHGSPALPSVSGGSSGVVISERLRRDETFSQFLAFGFTFDDATARNAVAGFARQVAAYRQSPEPWEGLSEAEQNGVIEQLLTDAVRHTIDSLPNGRPLTLGLSAGFDSRAILYACHTIGVRPTIFTYGQVGDLDFDLVKELSKRLDLKTTYFDTSEVTWSLPTFDRAAGEGQDWPISPRVVADGLLRVELPDRIELHGHLNDTLTGATTPRNPPRTWSAAVDTFVRTSDFFRWQIHMAHIMPRRLMPREPLVDDEALPFFRQLNLAYRQSQRLRPLPLPSLGCFGFPFEDERWVGFWLDRKPQEANGQRRYLRFLQALESDIFRDIADLDAPSTANAKKHRRLNYYGTGGLGGLVDLNATAKDIPRPNSRHFCLFAAHNNNASFRRMIDASIARLRKRNVFANSFIDAIVKDFHEEAIGSDSMLNGLVTTDIALEAGRFGK